MILEVRDAIGDIIYVINGMGVSFGFNIDECYNKFCNIKNSSSIFENVKVLYKSLDKINREDIFNQKE